MTDITTPTLGGTGTEEYTGLGITRRDTMLLATTPSGKDDTSKSN